MARIYWNAFKGASGEYPYAEDEAASARGWLLALCDPYDMAKHYNVHHSRMPYEDLVPGGWRESTSLGHYLDYERDEDGNGGVHVVAVCGAHVVQWFKTPEHAQEWLVEQARIHRPELFQEVPA